MHLHFASQLVPADDRDRVLGLPVTSVERTIADYIQDAGQAEQAEMAVSQAITKGLTTVPRLRAVAAERSGRVRDLIERSIEQTR